MDGFGEALPSGILCPPTLVETFPDLVEVVNFRGLTHPCVAQGCRATGIATGPVRRSSGWQTNRILSPVRLPYSWYWKHVAVILKGFDCEAVTILPERTYIVAALG